MGGPHLLSPSSSASVVVSKRSGTGHYSKPSSAPAPFELGLRRLAGSTREIVRADHLCSAAGVDAPTEMRRCTGETFHQLAHGGASWLLCNLVSQTDTDRMMIDVIEGRLAHSTVGSVERKRIAGRIATADFSKDEFSLRERAGAALKALVGAPHPSKVGEPLTEETILTSLEWHVLKHSVLDDSWPRGTSPSEYLADLRAAAQFPNNSIDLGRQTMRYPQGKTRVVNRGSVRTDVKDLPSKKATQSPDRCLLVLYDPSRGLVLSCYALTRKASNVALAPWSPRYSL